MSNQTERYHINLSRPEYEMPDYSMNLRGMRTPYGNVETNIIDKLIQNLTMQLDQSINWGQQGAGQTPNIKMPDIESLKPSLEYNLQKDNIGFGAGINVPSQGGMMDWLIKLSLGF